MKDLIGDQVDMDNIPFYGLAEAKVGGRDCLISQSGFSGEAGRMSERKPKESNQSD